MRENLRMISWNEFKILRIYSSSLNFSFLSDYNNTISREDNYALIFIECFLAVTDSLN